MRISGETNSMVRKTSIRQLVLATRETPTSDSSRRKAPESHTLINSVMKMDSSNHGVGDSFGGKVYRISLYIGQHIFYFRL